MKRLISIITGLALVFSLAGCGNKEPQKTEEQIREEVRLEMEAEEKAKEEAESQKTVNIKDDESVYAFLNEKYPGQYSRENFDDWNIVYSDFTGDGTKDAAYYSDQMTELKGVLFISVDGGVFKLIENEIEISKIYTQKISRKGDFIVHTITSGGTGLNVEVENLYAYNGEKIVDTGASLLTKGHESQRPTSDYPDGYLMAMKGETEGGIYDFMHTYTRTDKNKNEVVETIKTSYKYDPNTYKFLIEEIENSNKVDGEKDESKTDSKESSQASQNDASAAEKAYYDPADLKEGSRIGEFTVESIGYEKGRSFAINLTGEAISKGKIRGYFDDMYGENVYVFSSKEKLIDKPIMYKFNSGWENKVENIEGDIMNPEILDNKVRKYLLDGNEIEVTAVVGSYSHAYADETEGGAGVELLSVDIESQISIFVEDKEQGLSGFEKETFTTNNMGDYVVDYKDYKLVVVPMHETKNISKLEKIDVDFDGEYKTKLNFAVFGELKDVKLNNVANMGEEGQWKMLGDVKNAYIQIEANTPTDFSAVMVSGKYVDGSGNYEVVEFTLDDMRDESAYDIILKSK